MIEFIHSHFRRARKMGEIKKGKPLFMRLSNLTLYIEKWDLQAKYVIHFLSFFFFFAVDCYFNPSFAFDIGIRASDEKIKSKKSMRSLP